MARKPGNTVIEQDSPIAKEVTGALAESVNSMDEHSQQIMELYGEGLRYDRERIIGEARFYAAQSAEAVLEFGRRLLLIKEHEAHGDFSRIIDQQFGLNPRAAQRFMQGAVKYLSPKLQAKATALSHLGKTKLLELIGEDDDELAALADGGTVAGMTLDDIDRMSSRELRAALRKSREDVEDQQRVLEAKNKKIDDQMKRLSRISKQPADETNTQLRTEITQLVSSIDHEMRVNLFSGLNDLKMHGEDNDISQADFLRAQVTQLESTLSFLRENLCNGVAWE